MNTAAQMQPQTTRLLLVLLLQLTLFCTRSATAGLVLFDAFDDYTDGANLVAQGPGGNPWIITGGGNPAGIVTSNYNGGLAAFLGPTAGSAAYRSLIPAGLLITNTSTAATVFFQFSITDPASGLNNWSFVVTDRLPTDTAGSSQVQFNFDSSAANSGGGITTVRGRAGGSFKFLSTDGTKAGDVPMVPATTYSVWLLINKAASHFRIYMQNDSIPALAATPRQLFADDGTGGGIFGFRNGASPNSLTNINLGASSGQAGQNVFDNIYVDVAATNLTYPVPAPAVPTVSVPSANPASPYLYAGSALTLNVNAQGSPILRYLWQVDNGGGFVNLPGTDTNTIVVNATTSFPPGTYVYRAIVTNIFGAVTSAPSAQITIYAPSQPVLTAPITPAALTLYPGGNAAFNAAFEGTLPIALQWKKSPDQLTYTDVPGQTLNTLALTGVQLTDSGHYSLWASNVVNGGYTVSSGDALLTVLPNPAPPVSGFPLAILTNNPIGYWRFNDPVGSSIFDYAGGNQAYNVNITLGVAGLRSPAYPGFAGGNTAGSFDGGSSAATTGVSLLNGLTNFTITGWFNPAGVNAARAGLFGQNDVVEIGFDDIAGVNVGLRGSASTVWRTTQTGPAGFVAGNWYFVAVVADGSTLQLYVNGALRGQINNLGTPNGFSTDGFNMGGGGVLDSSGNAFNGLIEDVAVFSQVFSFSKIKELYTVAAGLRPPVLAVRPVDQTVYAGQTVNLVAVAEGADVLGYRWQAGPVGGPYTNLANGGLVSGVTTGTLTISSITDAYAIEYQVIVTNSLGAATSTPPALVTVLPTSPAEHITLSLLQPNGQDWNTGIYWSDGLPAAESALAKPGSTYEILPGGRLRTPDNVLEAVFPGDVLTVSGDGVWTNNPGTTTPIGEIRFKQAPPLGVVSFKELILNGGQLDTGNDGVVDLQGRITVLTTTPFYNDNANDRGYRLSGQLTGAGAIEFYGRTPLVYQASFVNGLNLTGSSNTFTGTWNIVAGTLVASAPGSLGTNHITIGAQGAIEAGYDLYSPDATLTLDGRFLLHGNHAFKHVIINGQSLPNGNYFHPQLAASFPANFPAAWTTQFGSTVNTASGSLSVGVPPPVSLQIESVGGQVELSWPKGTLLQADELAGPWQTNLAISPYLVNPTGARKFYRLQIQ